MPIAAQAADGTTLKENQLAFPFFADLVVLAGGLNPFPYRTRPLNPSAPMVPSLKAWKSRSLPGLPRTEIFSSRRSINKTRRGKPRRGFAFQAIHHGFAAVTR